MIFRTYLSMWNQQLKVETILFLILLNATSKPENNQNIPNEQYRRNVYIFIVLMTISSQQLLYKIVESNKCRQMRSNHL